MQPTVPATLARISGGLSYKRDTRVNRGDSFVKESHLTVTRTLKGSLKKLYFRLLPLVETQCNSIIQIAWSQQISGHRESIG